MMSGEVAQFLGVTPDAVRLFERTGQLQAERTGRGVRVFRRADVEQFAREREARRLRRPGRRLNVEALVREVGEE